MMKKEKRKGRFPKSAFRLEWEGTSDGFGRLYLFGVESFGEYRTERKCFRFSCGCVFITGRELSVLTYRFGGVEVTGKIAGVTFQPSQKTGGDGLETD